MSRVSVCARGGSRGGNRGNARGARGNGGIHRRGTGVRNGGGSGNRVPAVPISSRGKKSSQRGRQVRVPLQVPKEDFVFERVGQKGKQLVIPGNMRHAYEALARLIDNLYAGIPNIIGVPVVHEWKEEKFICDFIKFREFVTKFNEKMEEVRKDQNQLAKLPLAFQEFERLPKLSVENAIHLMDFAYRMAIPNPSVLNKGRSNQTYGEINPLQMVSIFDELKLTKEDVFMDMGSGIGQLVLLASLITPMQMSYGIELVETAANLAKAQQSWLSRVLNHVGKRHNRFRLFKKDFTNPIFVSMILDRVTVILVNNHVFGEDLMSELQPLLIRCRDGTRFVTTKPLVLGGRNGKERRCLGPVDMDDLEDCVEVKVLKCIGEGCVSWKYGDVGFYLNTFNRNKARYVVEFIFLGKILVTYSGLDSIGNL
ncbi:unnamed protein product [Caenorhabditis brenneri]